MNNIKKCIVIILVIILGISINCKIFAVERDPNSSKGFADYDDATAEEENEKLMDEQRQQQQLLADKSTNNYLNDLQVEGYKLSPDFDKQTIQYTLQSKVDEEKINIIAKADDEKATIQGSGEIELKDGKNQYRIDVTAESGTVRTYFIEIEKGSIENNSLNENELNTVNVQNDTNTMNTNINNNLIFIMIILLLIIFIVVIIIKKNSYNAKRIKK